MRILLKWIVIILGGLVVLLVVAAIGLSFAGSSRLSKVYDVQPETITIPTDEATLARGEHLVNVYCQDCHTADLSGKLLGDETPLFTLHATNITGLAETHSDEELVLAIRHGLRRDGRPLLIMPSESFMHLSAEDLGAVIAYLKSVPRTGDHLPEPRLFAVGRILAGAGLFDSGIPSSYIDHKLPFPAMPEIGPNVAYGKYLSGLCQSCHGEDLAGKQPSNPDSPPAPGLTPAGNLGNWTEEDFIAAIRMGVTPDGQHLNPEFMPWPSLAKHGDDELRALWLYLASLPPGQTASE